MKLEDWPEHVRQFVPPGFDLDNYKRADLLTKKEWQVEVGLRRTLRSYDAGYIPEHFKFGLYCCEGGTFYEWDDPDGYNYKYLEKFSKRDAINVYEKLNDDKEIIDYLKFKEARDRLIIKKLSEQSPPAAGSEDELTMFDQADQQAAKMLGFSLEPIINPTALFDLSNNSRSCLFVDVSAPLDVLREEFTQWVEQQRNRLKVLAVIEPGRRKEKPVDEKSIKRFASARVLAYWDLMYWYKNNPDASEKPRYIDVQDLIFPENYLTGANKDRLKNTVQLARWLIERDGHRLLE